MREYIWLNERPIAVIDDVDTASPQLYFVHVDHLERPVMMTDANKAVVWQATFEPFGSVHAITGSASLNARFPGQWFMLESGLHYNWHRHYDPTTGRYTTPDPLGFVDGPSVYGYAGGSPLMYVDPDGQQTGAMPMPRFGPIELPRLGGGIRPDFPMSFPNSKWDVPEQTSQGYDIPSKPDRNSCPNDDDFCEKAKKYCRAVCSYRVFGLDFKHTPSGRGEPIDHFNHCRNQCEEHFGCGWSS